MNENNINKLFESARTQAPITTFDKASTSFTSNVGLTNTGLLAKWAKLSTQLKVIIMIGITALITTGAILVFSSTEHKATPKTDLKPATNKEVTESFERTVTDDGTEKTTYFNDDKKIVNVVVRQIEIENVASDTVEIITSSPIEETQFDKKPLEVEVKSSLQDSTKTVCFTIQKNTLDSELKEISQQAKAAGIQFSYSTWVWKGKIKRCTVTMRIDKGEGNFCETQSTLSGKFTKKIGWLEDGNGKAIELIN